MLSLTQSGDHDSVQQDSNPDCEHTCRYIEGSAHLAPAEEDRQHGPVCVAGVGEGTGNGEGAIVGNGVGTVVFGITIGTP